MRSRVFIGSSREGLKVASAVERQLKGQADIDLWNNHAVFPVGELTLPKLEACASNYDFALIVMTPDDVVRSRHKAKPAPRDNLIFEAGLFMGRIGRQRTLIIQSDKPGLKLPSDLDGLTVAFYKEGMTARNVNESVRSACDQVAQVLKALGLSEAKRGLALAHAAESMVELVQRAERLLSRFESRPKRFDSVASAAPALSDAMNQCVDAGLPITVDWLGMTMFNVWNTLPTIFSQLAKRQPKSLTLRVAMLASEWLRKNRINSEWTADSADHQCGAIKEFFVNRKRDGSAWNVDVRRYSHMPAIHGGLVNDRWLLLGTCQWDRNNNLWAGDRFYEWYSADDRNRGAERIAIFRGWFDICWRSSVDSSILRWKV